MDLLSSILIGISCGALTSYIQGYLNRKTFEMIIDNHVERLDKRIGDLKKEIEEDIEEMQDQYQTPSFMDHIERLEEKIRKLNEEKWEFINTTEPVKDKKGK